MIYDFLGQECPDVRCPRTSGQFHSHGSHRISLFKFDNDRFSGPQKSKNNFLSFFSFRHSKRRMSHFPNSMTNHFHITHFYFFPFLNLDSTSEKNRRKWVQKQIIWKNIWNQRKRKRRKKLNQKVKSRIRVLLTAVHIHEPFENHDHVLVFSSSQIVGVWRSLEIPWVGWIPRTFHFFIFRMNFVDFRVFSIIP